MAWAISSPPAELLEGSLPLFVSLTRILSLCAGQANTYLTPAELEKSEEAFGRQGLVREKRPARLLLLMAHFGKEAKSDAIIPKISQDMLAEMIGTTRSRVSFFMNKFRKLGFLEYNGGMHVHSSLLNIVLHD
jgi:hypothetical protein